MTDPWSLLRLLLAALAIMGSPGPSTISATAVGAAFGLRRALPYVTGLILGTATVLLAVAAGVVALVLTIPHATPVLLAASSIYILYLAWRIANAPPLAQAAPDLPAPSLPGGFFLAVANPKAWFAIAAVFAGNTLGAAAKIAVLAGMIVLIHLFWLLAGAALARSLRAPLPSRIANITLAAMLLAATALALLG